MSHNWNYDYPKIARESGFTLKQNKDGPLDWRTISKVLRFKLLKHTSMIKINNFRFYRSGSSN